MTETKENHIIDAAHAVFLRYGFKRTTMGDIADAAHMSRPALYLVFANKEEVFKAVVRKINARSLKEIEEGLANYASVQAKLKFAFLVWTVTPYEMILRSREAKELIFCAYEFASDVLNESGSAFEVLLTKMLEPVIKKSGNKTISAKKLAHILRGSARGLKEVAKDSKELRMLINDFVDLIMQVC